MCTEGYKFRGITVEKLDVRCSQGNWVTNENITVDSKHFSCEPKCDFCYNGGVCVAPDVCQCLPEFVGNKCETFKTVGGCSLGPIFVPNADLLFT